MASNKIKSRYVLDTLTEILGDSEGQTPEEIKEELRAEDENIDVKLDRLFKAQQKISMTSKRSALDRAKVERSKIENSTPKILEKYKEWTKEQIIEKLDQLIQSEDLETNYAHRDLEQRGKEEIISILEDIELTKKWKNLRQDDDNE